MSPPLRCSARPKEGRLPRHPASLSLTATPPALPSLSLSLSLSIFQYICQYKYSPRHPSPYHCSLFLSFSLATSSSCMRGAASSRPMALAALLFMAVLVLASCCGCSYAELPRVEHSAKADGSLSLLVVGDWGRKGLYNQSYVASQVGDSRLSSNLFLLSLSFCFHGVDYVDQAFFLLFFSVDRTHRQTETFVLIDSWGKYCFSSFFFLDDDCDRCVFFFLTLFEYRLMGKTNKLECFTRFIYAISEKKNDRRLGELASTTFLLLYKAMEIDMGRVGKYLDIDFVISTGDNFYDDGLTGIDDPAFEGSFTNIYTAKSLQKQWYSVLGNHDYRGNVLAQLSPALPKIDSRWLCMRSFILDAEIAHFFFVDTTPFVLSYWTDPEDHHYDWRGVAPRGEYISSLLKDLDSALKESTAKWKFVVGHHAIRSVSEHGDTEELVDLLLPIIKANYVDLYINGHDHCLEHVSSNDSPIQFLTSGGGSKAWRGIYTPNTDKLQFFYDGQGFMSLKLTKTRVKFAFYDIFGKPLHKWSLTKGFRSVA